MAVDSYISALNLSPARYQAIAPTASSDSVAAAQPNFAVSPASASPYASSDSSSSDAINPNPDPSSDNEPQGAYTALANVSAPTIRGAYVNTQA